MTENNPNAERGNRVVTTDGTPIGRVARVDDDGLYVHPDPGLLLGCDSWLVPSWTESEEHRVEAGRVVGVGDATVVLEPDGAAPSSERGSADAGGASDGNERTGGAPRR